MLIAVSSHRQFGQDAEIDRNQSLAKRSWESAFDIIAYLGPKEMALSSGKTHFIESEDYPRISTLMEFAGSQRGFVAILNADLVIKPEIRKFVRKMAIRGNLCSSSRRYHFDPNTCNFEAAELGNDRGRDIFIARSDVWRAASKIVPKELRIGNGRWDAWVTDFFRARYNNAFVDFTASKMVFHPIHGSRNRPYDEEIAKVQFHIPRA